MSPGHTLGAIHISASDQWLYVFPVTDYCSQPVLRDIRAEGFYMVRSISSEIPERVWKCGARVHTINQEEEISCLS